MTEQPNDKSFVQSWMDAEKKDRPDSEIVKAIAKFTVKDELDGAKLLAALKVMAKSKQESDG